jgi:hypothetical protein
MISCGCGVSPAIEVAAMSAIKRAAKGLIAYLLWLKSINNL